MNRHIATVIVAPIGAALSQERTAAYGLDAVFGIGAGTIRHPAELIAWLDDFHAQDDPALQEIMLPLARLKDMLAEHSRTRMQRTIRLAVG